MHPQGIDCQCRIVACVASQSKYDTSERVTFRLPWLLLESDKMCTRVSRILAVLTMCLESEQNRYGTSRAVQGLLVDLLSPTFPLGLNVCTAESTPGPLRIWHLPWHRRTVNGVKHGLYSILSLDFTYRLEAHTVVHAPPSSNSPGTVSQVTFIKLPMLTPCTGFLSLTHASFSRITTTPAESRTVWEAPQAFPTS